MCETCDYEQFLTKARLTLKSAGELPPSGKEFQAGVTKTVTSMGQWVKDKKHVTDKMKVAMDNMANGVQRWSDQEKSKGTKARIKQLENKVLSASAPGGKDVHPVLSTTDSEGYPPPLTDDEIPF